MDLVNVEPACVKLKEAQVAEHSDKVQHCWPGLDIRRYVHHSVLLVWIFCVEKEPKHCWDHETANNKQTHRSAVPSTDLDRELFTDDRRA
jgi:hypothetical protein